MVFNEFWLDTRKDLLAKGIICEVNLNLYEIVSHAPFVSDVQAFCQTYSSELESFVPRFTFSQPLFVGRIVYCLQVVDSSSAFGSALDSLVNSIRLSPSMSRHTPYGFVALVYDRLRTSSQADCSD